MSAANYTTSEMMTVAASRLLKNGAVCFVGIGLPSTAANLARLTHAPDIVLIYESGPIGAKPSVLPLSIGDGDLAERADTVVSTPEIFRYWLQGGRVDVGFLGAAQIDKFANINTTVIGDYKKPVTRLPGAGGAPEIASCAKEVVLVLKQSARAFVKKLDFLTSVGHLTGGDSRAKLGLSGKGPVAVVTDLCIMKPDETTKELTVTQLHPGVAREQVEKATGWDIKFASGVTQTLTPTEN
ncbi:MAG TPA: CoA-transferase subunit beta, partial [Candidatus Acidoferrum sp.]|nr:CoA-transferase subunit beta [Candidatus Acidoferrum sp.]